MYVIICIKFKYAKLFCDVWSQKSLSVFLSVSILLPLLVLTIYIQQNQKIVL